MGKAEAKIQQRSIDFAKRKGVPSIRMYLHPTVETGWPDVLFLIPGGRPLLIEFKAPGEVPNARQELKIRLLRELDYDVDCCDSEDKARRAIMEALERSRLSTPRQ